MNNAAFEKIMENARKHKLKLILTERSRTCLLWELYYHTTNCFKKKLLSIEIQIKKKEKTQIRMNKFVYLELSKPELSKILIY